jgi:hypothetical protein
MHFQCAYTRIPLTNNNAQDYVRHQAQVSGMDSGTVKYQEIESMAAVCRRVRLTVVGQYISLTHMV